MKSWWLCGILILSLASPLLARQGVLKTKDGQTLTGDIDSDSSDSQIIVTIHNVQTMIARDNVASISYSDNADSEYQTRLGKLAPNDIAGRMQLAQWAFDLKRYDLAHDACQQVFSIDPNNRQASAFEDTIQQQQVLEHRRPDSDTSGGDASGQATPGGQTPPADQAAPAANGDAGAPPANDTTARQNDAHNLALSPKYLTANQINTIRQDELKGGDPQVRVAFNDDVRRKFIAASGADAAQFLAQTPLDQALAILANGGPKMIPDVRVLNDPMSLALYRQKIQPMILSGCAASGCHGGGSAGDLFLYNNNTEAASYTNFYILQSFSKAVAVTGQYATPAPVVRQMIDRISPNQSLLVQYCLPPAIADIPHPRAGDYRGVFRDASDPRMAMMVAWMGQILINPAPNYGIHFQLPLATPTKPATAPTTQPGQ